MGRPPSAGLSSSWTTTGTAARKRPGFTGHWSIADENEKLEDGTALKRWRVRAEAAGVAVAMLAIKGERALRKAMASGKAFAR
jgi:hypothetical protein